MPTNAEQALQTGSAILAATLANHGFVFHFESSGRGSGGDFASGAFVRGNRMLEIHFRYSLGLVTYRLGDRALSHEAFMWSVLGKPHASHYPGFSDDPMGGFRDLRADLEEYGADFLKGADTEFLRHCERAIHLEKTRPRLPV